MIEVDPTKAKRNLADHNIHLAEAETVLYDPLALTQEDGTADGEQRFLTVGMDAEDRILAVVYTWRGDNIRLISARKATGRENEVMKAEYDLSNAKRGAVIPSEGKKRITMYLDNDVLEAFKVKSGEQGIGYQTLINSVLREHLGKQAAPIDEATLRRVIREEMHGDAEAA